MSVLRPPAPPLLTWPERAEIARLADERASLAVRVAALRPHSHRRVALQARLAELTERQLRAEQALAQRAAR